MSFTGKQQLAAFICVLAGIVLIGGAPMIVAGAYGKSLPDALIANSDKTVAGLIGVLGTLAGLLFRRNASDDVLDNKRADNTAKLADAITATANATGSTTDAGKAADTVADAAVEAAEEVKGKA